MVNNVNLKASVSFVGDGSTNKFYFGFDYINKQFVKVQVGAGSSPLTYLTDYTVDDRSVTLTDTPDVGVAIRVYRETSSDRIVEWTDGAFIKASQMTLENLQQLHLIEEAQDYPILNSLSRYPDGVNFNALGSRVINARDPQDEQDVVTKHYMENVQSGFVAVNTNILNETKDTLNATKQTQSKAQANENLSKAWAVSTESPDGAEDTQSDTGKTQSSRTWALRTIQAEQNAKTSETNAKASETKAKTSETNAKTSETNAKASETKAFTSEQHAKTSETNAKTSETNASASAAASASSASASATSATKAKTSETNAKTSETNSEISHQKAKKWAEATDSPDGEVDTNSPTGYTQSAKIWAALSKEYAGLSKFKLPIGYYNSVDEMRKSDTALVGRPCVTLGYYEPNDGGGSVYIIRQKKENDVDDGGSILVLDNGNVAELIIDGAVNVKQFGAKGDGATDNITAMQNCINYAFEHSIDTYIPSGTYCISNALYVYQWQHVNGAGREQTYIKRKTDNTDPKYSVSAIFILDKIDNYGRSYTEGQNISNMYLISDTFIDYGIYSGLACPYTNINNIVINKVKNGIVYNAGTWLAEISDVHIANPEIGIKITPNGTSLHLKNTYVVAPSKIGYYTYALLYSSWENIACDRATNDAICYEFYASNINISGLGAESREAKNIITMVGSNISVHSGTLFGLTTDDKREMISVYNGSLSLDSVNIGVNLKTPIVNNICLKGIYGAYFDIKNCTVSEYIKNVHDIIGDWSNSIQWDTGNTTSHRYVIGESYKNRQIIGSFNLIGNVGGTPSKLLTGEDAQWQETAPHIGDLLVNQNPKNGIALFQAITDNSPYNMQGKITNIAENVLTFDSLELDNIANTRGIVITTDGTLNNVKIVAIDTQNKRITVADSSKFTVGESPAYRTNGVYVRDNKYMGVQQVLALSTTNRITNPIAGMVVFDTTLNKPIWYTGQKWVDANGNNV